MTLHFFSPCLPTCGRGVDVATDRAWRIEWSAMFFQMCQATGGTLLFDLDLYRERTPAARRLFLKLKDRFWRSKRVFLNVDDLTIHGLGFSVDRLPAWATTIGAKGDRRSTRNSAWDSRKPCHALPAPHRPDGLSNRGAELLSKTKGACVVVAPHRSARGSLH